MVIVLMFPPVNPSGHFPLVAKGLQQKFGSNDGGASIREIGKISGKQSSVFFPLKMFFFTV